MPVERLRRKQGHAVGYIHASTSSMAMWMLSPTRLDARDWMLSRIGSSASLLEEARVLGSACGTRGAGVGRGHSTVGVMMRRIEARMARGEMPTVQHDTGCDEEALLARPARECAGAGGPGCAWRGPRGAPARRRPRPAPAPHAHAHEPRGVGHGQARGSGGQTT